MKPCSRVPPARRAPAHRRSSKTPHCRRPPRHPPATPPQPPSPNRWPRTQLALATAAPAALSTSGRPEKYIEATLKLARPVTEGAAHPLCIRRRRPAVRHLGVHTTANATPPGNVAAGEGTSGAARRAATLGSVTGRCACTAAAGTPAGASGNHGRWRLGSRRRSRAHHPYPRVHRAVDGGTSGGRTGTAVLPDRRGGLRARRPQRGGTGAVCLLFAAPWGDAPRGSASPVSVTSRGRCGRRRLARPTRLRPSPQRRSPTQPGGTTTTKCAYANRGLPTSVGRRRLWRPRRRRRQWLPLLGVGGRGGGGGDDGGGGSGGDRGGGTLLVR